MKVRVPSWRHDKASSGPPSSAHNHRPSSKMDPNRAESSNDTTTGKTQVEKSTVSALAAVPHENHAPTELSKKPSSPTPTSLFLTLLPSDLHHHLIATYLDWPTITALRLTHSHFAALTPPPTLHRLRTTIITSLLATETALALEVAETRRLLRLLRLELPIFGRLDFDPPKELRCYGCLRVLTPARFHARMVHGGMVLGGKSAAARMCKRCVVERGRVKWGHWEREVELQALTIARSERLGLGLRRARRRQQVYFEAEGGLRGANEKEQIEEHGVCARCRKPRWRLWWGCARCFEAEEKARQRDDRDDLNVLGRGVLNFMERWRDFREGDPRKGRGSGRGKGFLGIQGRRECKAAKERMKSQGQSQRKAMQTSDSTATKAYQPRRYRAREIRCASCWTPNLPRRPRWYNMSLALDHPLPLHRWCELCRGEDDGARKVREIRKGKDMGKGEGEGEQRRWSFDGLGGLFD